MPSRSLNIVFSLTEPEQGDSPRPVFQFTMIIALMLILLAPRAAPGQAQTLAARIERSAALISENKIAEAEQELNGVLKIAPSNAGALDLLGTVRAQQGRLKEAEALFLRALRIDNRLVGAHMNLAYLYLLEGAPEKTISELKEVLRLDPNNPEAAYKLAQLQLSQGQVDECIQLLEQVSRSGPRPPALVIVLGDAYLSRGNADKAEESYLLALNQQSDAADAVLGLAQISQMSGDPKSVSLYLARAKELACEAPDLLYKFATVALKVGAVDQARSALEQAVKLRTD